MNDPYPTGTFDGKTQIYSKHTYPKINGSRPPGNNADDDDNMQILFLNEPQTDAEIEMHNLWLAKRKQEVK